MSHCGKQEINCSEEKKHTTGLQERERGGDTFITEQEKLIKSDTAELFNSPRLLSGGTVWLQRPPVEESGITTNSYLSHKGSGGKYNIVS